jgi:hypothetical protein
MKGDFQKDQDTTWNDTITKKFNNKAGTTGKVMHATSNEWHENYPQTKLYEQYFNVAWTQGYNGSGAKLDYSVHGDHPKAGDTFGFIGLFGFNNADLKSFVDNGEVQNIQIEVAVDSNISGVSPDIYFGSHFYWEKPNTVNWQYIDSQYKTLTRFVNYGYDYRKWVQIPIEGWWNGTLGGIAVWGETSTAADYARFAGKTTSHQMIAFNSRLFVKVLK